MRPLLPVAEMEEEEDDAHCLQPWGGDVPPLSLSGPLPPSSMPGCADAGLYPVEEEEEDVPMLGADEAVQQQTQPPHSDVIPSHPDDDASGGVTVPPNAAVPGAFALPAYEDDSGYSLSYPTDSDYLIPSESHHRSRRSLRRRGRTRGRSGLWSFLRLPCSRRIRRFLRLKRKERNLPAAAISLVVITSLVASLIIPRWFSLSGGACRLHHLGAIVFFSIGQGDLGSAKHDGEIENVDPGLWFISSSTNEINWSDCITGEVVNLMRSVIVLIFAAISFTSAAFFLDSLGARSRPYKLMRRNALGNIISVLVCVVVNGLAYWVSTLLRAQQSANKSMAGKKVDVSFDVSFYLVVAAGGLSVIATAANLLKQHPTEEEEQINRLVDCDEDYDDDEDGVDDSEENRLQRRLRRRGDWDSLCGLSYGDTVLSTYPRSFSAASRMIPNFGPGQYPDNAYPGRDPSYSGLDFSSPPARPHPDPAMSDLGSQYLSTTAPHLSHPQPPPLPPPLGTQPGVDPSQNSNLPPPYSPRANNMAIA